MPKKNIDYSNTVMYKIVCKDLNIQDVYIGHTTRFKQRKNCHKTKCQNENDTSYHEHKYKIMRENGGWDNWEMIEIEKYPCSDGNEARSRERYWYELFHSTLNTCYPNRTIKEYEIENIEHRKAYFKTEKVRNIQKEYREKNKEKIQEYKKEYALANKELISERKKEVIVCSCGSTYRRDDKARHLKTQKHLNHIN